MFLGYVALAYFCIVEQCQGFLKHYVNEKKQYPECGSTDEQARLI